MNRLVEQELSGKGGDPQLEARALAERIAGCDRLRSAYQDQQAAELMTLEELGGKLEELDRTRGSARSELERLRKRGERVEERERDRDAVIESHGGMCPTPWTPCRVRRGGGSTGCFGRRSRPRRTAWRSRELLVLLNPVQ
jgi:hypothetical protein